ncbi:unnamed protein product [Tuber melanosporum]|uniref:(Perigord truffle) hypothetical protein n=1 Tax=Tuber melanosporum (strain Mel28) TaxID=656061 RepID=D5GJY9_TUBMM|nr:uncharacterized protein GSTUM_00009276001 [Tuber melanosporum]CAZ84832.1 unnamed protein product [Tuber melanosporum]
MESVRIECASRPTIQVAANSECIAYADKRFRIRPSLKRIEEHQKFEATITHEQSRNWAGQE